MQPFEIPEAGIPTTELMNHAATIQMNFAFVDPPEFLTIQQDISDENFIFPSEMKLTLHQAGTDLTYTDALKPGAAITQRFDWSGDLLTEDASDEEWNDWFEKQREATLGITSYSSVYSFLYVEPAEIRHEVLIPLATMATYLPLEHEDPSFIEVAEQDAVRAQIREWLQGVNPTTINGQEVAPEFTRIDFYGLDLRDFAQQAEQRRVSLANGRVGIILTYRTPDNAIRHAELTWNRFHASLRKVESVVIPFTGQPHRFEFSRFQPPDENVFVWDCPPEALPAPVERIAAEIPPKPTLRIPWLSGVCLVFGAGVWLRGAGRTRMAVAAACLLVAVVFRNSVGVVIAHPWKHPPRLESADARDIFTRLHQGMYRALDFGSEEQIFAALSRTVDGELLEEMYLQLRQGLEVRDQGGAVARVRSVSYPDQSSLAVTDAEAPWPGYRIRATWQVAGTVEHWGHIHERQNQFEALFRVMPRDGVWKICDMSIENQSRVAAKTRVRSF